MSFLRLRFGREGDYSIRDVRYDSFAERKICGLYLKGSYAGLQELYNTINIDFNYTKRHGMAFEEYVSYSEEDDDTQVTKIYIPIK